MARTLYWSEGDCAAARSAPPANARGRGPAGALVVSGAGLGFEGFSSQQPVSRRIRPKPSQRRCHGHNVDASLSDVSEHGTLIISRPVGPKMLMRICKAAQAEVTVNFLSRYRAYQEDDLVGGSRSASSRAAHPSVHYFAVASETMTADEMAVRIGLQPDQAMARGSRRIEPKVVPLRNSGGSRSIGQSGRLAARPRGYRASRVAGGILPSLGAGGGAAHGLRAGVVDVG
jgi:hypothetical protein